MYAANDADETLRAHRAGLTWFLFALWLAVRNVTCGRRRSAQSHSHRQTPAADCSARIHIFWCTLLLGWCIPIILGLRLLRRKLN